MKCFSFRIHFDHNFSVHSFLFFTGLNYQLQTNNFNFHFKSFWVKFILQTNFKSFLMRGFGTDFWALEWRWNSPEIKWMIMQAPATPIFIEAEAMKLWGNSIEIMPTEMTASWSYYSQPTNQQQQPIAMSNKCSWCLSKWMKEKLKSRRT